MFHIMLSAVCLFDVIAIRSIEKKSIAVKMAALIS